MSSRLKTLNFGQYVPNDKVLNKKIHENPKYKDVKPAIDSGKNVRRHIDELKEKQKNCVHKKDEVFRRIKFSTFIRLALAVANEVLTNESTRRHDDAAESNNEDPSKEITGIQDKKKVANVLVGIGELDLLHEKKKSYAVPPKPEKKLPYLLLDVRDRDDFYRCHIITAKPYPAAMLSRAIGYETEELKLYKNRPYELIILYDDDEVIASRVATTLVERGYDNIYILSGGLKFGLEMCPHGLTTSGHRLTPVHLSNIQHGTTSHVQQSASKDYFSQEDLNIIQHYIEAYLQKDNEPTWSSRSKSCGPSKNDKSIYTSQKGTDSEQTPVYKPGLLTSRRGSGASSLKSTEQLHIRSDYRSATARKPKTAKKAPWK